MRLMSRGNKVQRIVLVAAICALYKNRLLGYDFFLLFKA